MQIEVLVDLISEKNNKIYSTGEKKSLLPQNNIAYKCAKFVEQYTMTCMTSEGNIVQNTNVMFF